MGYLVLMRPLHLSAPGHGPGPDALPVPPDDRPLAGDLLSVEEDGASELDSLVSEAWPDDAPDEEVLPEVVLASIESLDLGEIADDGGSELVAVIPQEAPRPDPAPDPVVVGWRCTAMVDGEEVPAVCDPMASRTTWTRPGGRGRVHARLRVAGVVVETEVDLSDGRPALRLGRDVLAGRFWIEV